ncbi:hypothetical protein Aple_100650 [Acrocarpospora pleiomorpha]|uniref:Uncharacterized protein n=1 Tax=Acrocarpospora pleiomorpha TaxID=90975 RepID=A0A5M3Y1T3_9ACTN|nr:hypothetical protein [Acrocarpospora pleiomorpha]GES27166.1 hypothetical protein Aple_100650 [Acrocarpospora pleiomorpha]
MRNTVSTAECVWLWLMFRSNWKAVTAGLTLAWSSGAVEGAINRIIMWNLICQAGPCGLSVDIGWPVP